MGDFEALLFIGSIILTCVFLFKWYNTIFSIWKVRQIKLVNYIFSFLPLICFIIILYTLINLASFDVVDSSLYICFYLFLGFVWIYLGIKLIFYFLDLSWVDDVLNNGNKSALFTITGAIIGLTLIYSGANIGDGPGFWCVFIAGGIGFIAWIILIKVLNLFTGVIESVLVTRDVACGVRFGSFLIASGIILARASGGDWTSLNATLIEFLDGWVVLPLLLLYIIIETIYKFKTPINSNIASSIFISLLIIALAILSVLYVIPPFKENPIYDLVFIKFLVK